jgi:hypothetical protein
MNFKEILERRLRLTREVLGSKEKEYANNTDRFHNFHVIAGILECTPAEALIGPMSKHIFSVIDILVAQEFDPWLFENMIKHINKRIKRLERQSSMKSQNLTIKYIDEKIGDTINYLILLEGLLHGKIECLTSTEEDGEFDDIEEDDFENDLDDDIKEGEKDFKYTMLKKPNLPRKKS